MKNIYCFILTFFLLFSATAQSDLKKLSWKFRGPTDDVLVGKPVLDITNDPNDKQTIWICNEDGLFYNENIEDATNSWKQIADAPKLKVLVFDRSATQRMYGISDSTIYVSNNRGKNWQTIANPAKQTLVDIWVSDKGKVIVYDKNNVFLLKPDGISWTKTLNSLSPIAQLWIANNQLLYLTDYTNYYVSKDDTFQEIIGTTKAITDTTTNGHRPLSKDFSNLKGLNYYYQYFRNDPTKILEDGFIHVFSVNNGKDYLPIPQTNTVGLIKYTFSKNNLIIATSEGVLLVKSSSPSIIEKRNLGITNSFLSFVMEDKSGSDYFEFVTNRHSYILYDHVNAGQAFLGNSLDYSTSGKLKLIYDMGAYFGYANNDGINLNIPAGSTTVKNLQNVIPINGDSFYKRKLFISDSSNIYTFIIDIGGFSLVYRANLTAVPPRQPNISIADFQPSLSKNFVYVLYKDGLLLKLGDLLNTDNNFTKQEIKVPSSSKIKFFRELSEDGKELLVSSENGQFYYSNDAGKTWKILANTTFNSLIINELNYIKNPKSLFLATNQGVWASNNPFDDLAVWASVSPEVATQNCIQINYRADGTLAVLTDKKGIYSTIIFPPENKIITYAPEYLYRRSDIYNIDGYKASPTPYACVGSKLPVYFDTNIPENAAVEYSVEITDGNGNFSTNAILLNGKSTKSPILVDFPNIIKDGSYQVRVIAKGSINFLGNASPSFELSNKNVFTSTGFAEQLYCKNDVVTLKTNLPISSFQWQKDGKTIENANNQSLNVNQIGNYIASYDKNGCSFLMNFEVKNSIQKFDIAANSNLSCDTKKTLSITNSLANTTFKWYKDGQPITNATNPTLSITEKGFYYVEQKKTESGCVIPSNVYANTPRKYLFMYIIALQNNINDAYAGINRLTLSDTPRDNKSVDYYKDGKLVQSGKSFELLKPTDGVYEAIVTDLCGNIITTKSVKVENGKSLSIEMNAFSKPCGGNKLTARFDRFAEVTVAPDRSSKSTNYRWFKDGNELPNTNFNTINIPNQASIYQVEATFINEKETYLSAPFKVNSEDFLANISDPIFSVNACKDHFFASFPLENAYIFKNFQWYKDGKILPNETYLALNGEESGVYSVKAQAYEEKTDGSFDCFFESKPITFQKTAQPLPTVGYSYSGGACVIDSFKIFTPILNKNSTFRWFKDDAILPNTTNELIAKDLSKYQVELTNENGCVALSNPVVLKTCADVKTNKAILINPPTISADKNSIFSSEKATINIENCSNVNFQWLKNDQVITNAINNKFQTNEVGNYSLKIEKAGCTATSNVVQIKLLVETILGINSEEIERTFVKTYPNPSTQIVSVEVNLNKISSINWHLIDISGKIIKNWSSTKAIQHQEEINVSELSDGAYFLKIETDEGVFVRKIIKR